jgi:hypothetical protein
MANSVGGKFHVGRYPQQIDFGADVDVVYSAPCARGGRCAIRSGAIGPILNVLPIRECYLASGHKEFVNPPAAVPGEMVVPGL